MQAIPCRLTEVKAPVAVRGEQIAVGDSCSINHDCFPGLLCIHPICLGGFMLVIRYRFNTRAIFESGFRLQLEELILKLASAPSAFLKSKMPPALIQASKSLR